MLTKYDYIVIGSGPAGHISALTAARLGLKTAIVEKDLNMMGGVCLNEGCIPAKSLYASAHLFDTVNKYPFVETFTLDPHKALSDMVAKSRRSSEILKQGLLNRIKRSGIEVIEGQAEFKGISELKITEPGGKSLNMIYKNALIATGSAPRVLPGTLFSGDRIISSSKAVRLETVPSSVLIVGGGAIGVEFASFFSTMGSEVTLLEAQRDILPSEDRDVSSFMRNVLRKRGIRVIVSAVPEKILEKDNCVSVRISEESGEISESEYDIVIAAVGRSPLTEDLGLSAIGIKTDEKGFIRVDRKMRTNIKGVYAAGDVVPTPMLAHVAQAEGEIAALAASGSTHSGLDYTNIPNAVYSTIQTASVGATETQAEFSGSELVVGKSFFKANGKAVAVGQDEGFVKIIVDTEKRTISGAHIVGYLATEIIHELVLARKMSLTVDDIAAVTHAHPTFSESVAEAAKEAVLKLQK